MNILDVILIGIALSMDATALTISNCSTYKNTLNKKKEWAMPIAFALFQGIMPLLGFLLGKTFSESIAPYAEFISCAVFFALALKILIDLLRERNKKEEEKKHPPFSYTLLIIQAVATSIDAFIIGITFASYSMSVFIAVSIIAAVTFVIVTIALLFGKYLGKILGKGAEWFGMAILFALSIKSLIEALI